MVGCDVVHRSQPIRGFLFFERKAIWLRIGQQKCGSQILMGLMELEFGLGLKNLDWWLSTLGSNLVLDLEDLEDDLRF